MALQLVVSLTHRAEKRRVMSMPAPVVAASVLTAVKDCAEPRATRREEARRLMLRVIRGGIFVKRIGPSRYVLSLIWLGFRLLRLEYSDG